MLPPTPGPTLALQLPVTTSSRPGYQVNVLGSSLVARLKQRQPKEAAKPPKGPKSKPALRNNNASMAFKLEGLHEEEDMHSSDDGHIACSTSSRTAPKRQGKTSSQRSRTGSAASGDTHILPRLTSASRSPAGSRISSRRSLSAGPSQERVESRRSGACASASSFAPRAPNCPVHVIKKDGVFQPADKYMPGRTAIREAGPATLWDYHTYVLPVMDSNSETQSPRYSDSDLSPRGMFLGSGKKRMKVSWKAGLDPEVDGQYIDGLPESRQDTNPTPSTPAPASASKQRRAQSVDNLAFRRPVYHSGHSRVSSIGLKWQIPAGGIGQLSNIEPSTDGSSGASMTRDGSPPASTLHQITVTPNSTSKPMWSYLITHDTKQQQQQSPPPPSQLSTRNSGCKPTKKDSKASSHGQRHYRDVHPVSTAMERYGTSVSKTRWTVPSSSASGLEAERAVRDRLQLVKRTGSLLLYEPGGRGTSNSAAQRFQQAMVAAGRADDIEDANRGEHGSVSYRTSKDRDGERDETDGSHLSAAQGRLGKGEQLAQETPSGTNDGKALSAPDDDQMSSPTKSRSTLYN